MVLPCGLRSRRRGSAALPLLLGLLSLTASGAPTTPKQDVPAIGDWRSAHSTFRPLPLGDVEVRGFLGKHIDLNNRKSLPAGLESAIPAAILARLRGEEPPPETRRLAVDSDFYKWLEGACYAIRYGGPDPGLEEDVERYAEKLVELQDPDGYLGTRISPAGPFDQRVAHDLYCAGHFFEAAVAHYRATGSKTLLNAAGRLADFYLRALEEKHPYFAIVGTREHPEVEVALVRLSRATGERKYLEFARKVTHMSRIGPRVADVRAGGGGTHAVRFCYLLEGAAEICLETGDRGLLRLLISLWNELVSTRMYITGGLGYEEKIPIEPYDLPQCIGENTYRDIAETCASVALMMFSWRMHALTGESRYMDAIETILYNHYLGAISPDHLGNFYYNPLRRVGDLAGQTDHGGDPVQRTRLPEIHSTTCCLPNSWRFFSQLPEYIFSRRGPDLAVNLYTGAVARYALEDGTRVRVTVETRYPLEGEVTIHVSPETPKTFQLLLRIPAWCHAASVTEPGSEAARVASGRYHGIQREWRPGDEVVLNLPMEPVVLASRPEIVANRGQVALRRGPLVYCLEKQDAGGIGLDRAVLALDRGDPAASIAVEFDTEADIHVLWTWIGEQSSPPSGAGPYPSVDRIGAMNLRQASWIPFYFRANRSAHSRWITFIPVEKTIP